MSASLIIKGGRFNEQSDDNAAKGRGPLEESTDKLTYQKDSSMLLDSVTEGEIRMKNNTSS